MNLVGYSLEFGWQIFDCRQDEQGIGQTTPGEFAIDLFGDFLEWRTVGVNTNKEVLRVQPRRVVDKQTVSGSEVNNNASVMLLVRSNQILKCSPVNLSKGSTAD